MLKSGQVGGVLLLLLEGDLQFTGDPHKVHRDGRVRRASAFGARAHTTPDTTPSPPPPQNLTPFPAPSPPGELCTDAVLRAGDVLAIGRPGDETMLAVLYNAAMETEKPPEGQPKLLEGRTTAARSARLTEVRFLAIAMPELLHYIGPAPAVLQSPDGIRAILLNVPWYRTATGRSSTSTASASSPRSSSKGDILVQNGPRAAPPLPSRHACCSRYPSASRYRRPRPRAPPHPRGLGQGAQGGAVGRREDPPFAHLPRSAPARCSGERSIVTNQPSMASVISSSAHDAVALLLQSRGLPGDAACAGCSLASRRSGTRRRRAPAVGTQADQRGSLVTLHNPRAPFPVTAQVGTGAMQLSELRCAR